MPDAACPGCSTPAPYTADKNGPITHYPLDTFIDQAADQGVLPHLMAIGTFHRSQPRPHFLPGANLQVSGRPQRDVGIIGTFNGRILAGEVETSPADFTQEHITHDISTNAGIGADIHLMAAIHPISAANREIAETQGNSHDMELRAPISPNLQ